MSSGSPPRTPRPSTSSARDFPGPETPRSSRLSRLFARVNPFAPSAGAPSEVVQVRPTSSPGADNSLETSFEHLSIGELVSRPVINGGGRRHSSALTLEMQVAASKLESRTADSSGSGSSTPDTPTRVRRMRSVGSFFSPTRFRRTNSSGSKAGRQAGAADEWDEPGQEVGPEVDDEACFVDLGKVPAIDFISQLPPEIALYTLLFLPLESIVSALSVSRDWNSYASDQLIWRDLFHRRGWTLRPITQTPPGSPGFSPLPSRSNSLRRGSANDPGFFTPMRRLLSSPSTATLSGSNPIPSPLLAATPRAPLAMEWMRMYKERLEIEMRWRAQGRSCKDEGWEPSIRWLEGHSDSVYCSQFDAEKIITGSRDRTIRIWAVPSLQLLGTLVNHHASSVLCLQFQGTFMVTGGSDTKILVWKLGTRRHAGKGRVVGRLEGHEMGVLDLCFDDEHIVSCSKDTTILVFSRRTLQRLHRLEGHDGPVNAVGLQQGLLASASGDGRLKLWNVYTGEVVRVFEGHERGLACIQFRGNMIISGSNDRTIRVWDVSQGACVRTLSGHGDLVRTIAFDEDRGLVVSGSYDKSVRVWDLRTGECLREFRDGHESLVFDVQMDCGRIVSTSHDQRIMVINFTEGLELAPLFA